jgi:hypothetical protein
MKALELARTARRRMYVGHWPFATTLEKMMIEDYLSQDLRWMPRFLLLAMTFAAIVVKDSRPWAWGGLTYPVELLRRMVERESLRRLSEEVLTPGTMVGDTAADLFGDVSDAKGNYDA